MESDILIKLESIGRWFPMGQEKLWVLRGVNLEIRRGEFVAIVGPSGSGKSTLMNIIGCLMLPSEGRFSFDHYEVTGIADDPKGSLSNEEQLARFRNRSIGFIFQQFHLLPRHDAVANTLLPTHYAGISAETRPYYEKRARDLLSSFGLKDRMTHKPNELSGGQKQKTAIARALLLEPSLILADEPTGNLDSKSAHDILAELDKLHAKGHTILLVTHDHAVAERAWRKISIADGQIVEDKATPRAGTLAAHPIAPEKADAPKLAAVDRPLFIQAIERIWERYAKDGLQNIARNRNRSALTILGVVIGVAAVIAMITIGNFAKTKIMGSFQSFGTNIMWVYTSRPPKQIQRLRAPDPANHRKDHFNSFDYKSDILALKAALPDIDSVSPEMEVYNGVVGRKEILRDSTRVRGVNEDYLNARGITLNHGRNFLGSDIKHGENVAIIGKRVADELFYGEEAVGKELKVERQQKQGGIFRVLVIGVLNPIDADEYRDPNDVVLVPFSVVQNKFRSSSWQRNIGYFIVNGKSF
jgi:macrolide transport system ATP-binding/permease protein